MAFLTMTMLLAGAAVAADVAASSTQARKFPELQAANVDRQKFRLPDDFAGEHNLVLIAFQREQQSMVDTWLAEMKQFQKEHPGFEYYELPTVEKFNAMTRWMIDNAMHRGITDPNARSRTITLYIDKKPFKDALEIPSENQIYALLLDRDGNVIWRTEGVFDSSKGKKLREVLRISK